jgi:nucleotide-binding universal stress UspA family protein
LTEIREILFPSDLSPASDRAFEHVRVLAEAFEARVTLFHALGPALAARPPSPEDEERAWALAAEQARRSLEERAQRLAGPQEVIVRQGVSAVRALVDLAILDLMRSRRPDLTVMASSGQGGLSGLLLGSVAQQVVLAADRPVLCVRPPEAGARVPYRRLLVTTDLSAASRRAFPLAAALARRFGASVIGVHVLRPEGPRPAPEELRAFLEPDFGGLALEPRVYPPGPPWHRITETAKAEEADLVVMATHGHDSVSDHILGSNTERVLRHAPCPVLAA